MGVVGSGALTGWIMSPIKGLARNSEGGTFTSKISRLKKLNLSSCQLDFYPVFNAIAQSLFSDSLISLDVSNNKFDTVGIDAFAKFLGYATSLIDLKCVGCSLSQKHCVLLLNIITSNSKLKGINIDLASNDFGKEISWNFQLTLV